MVEIHQHDLQPLLNSFNEGICCLSAQGELLSFNEVAQAHWNLNRQPTSKLTSQTPVRQALAGQHTHHELVHLSEQHVLLVNALPIYQGTDSVKSIVIISQDVTEHILMERQAQTALDMLVEAVIDTHGIHDIDEALRRIAVLIPQLESVDNSIAFRVDDETGHLIPLALFGLSQQSYEEWHAELSAIELNTEATLRSSPAYMQALRLKRPLMFDFASAPTFSNPNNLRAAIYAPVLLNGKVIGLLGAERHRAVGRTGVYFPQWSVYLLTALARLASISLEKSTLLNSSDSLEQELQEVRKLLSQRDEFLSLTAHELKNPLTAIRGQAQVLRRLINRSVHAGSDTSQATHDLVRGLESIEHQTRRIEHLINTLLDVNQLDLDRLELEVDEIDLIQLARRALEEHLALARNHELHLLVNGQPVPIASDNSHSSPTAPMKIEGDEERLEQVLSNLISNAIKYSPQDGPITVSLQFTSDGHVEIAVEDRGIGVSPKDQARLTERFFRAENAQFIDSKGLGLGLYLVNALVNKHGGSLSLKSEGIPGKGSTFIIKLPYRLHQIERNHA